MASVASGVTSTNLTTARQPKDGNRYRPWASAGATLRSRDLSTQIDFVLSNRGVELSEHFHLRLPAGYRARLEKIARDRGVSPSTLVRAVLQVALPPLEG